MLLVSSLRNLEMNLTSLVLLMVLPCWLIESLVARALSQKIVRHFNRLCPLR